MSEIKEFILLAGYRRYNAVKKLGWKKVNANVYGEDKVVEININDIDFGDNVRKDEKSHEIIELMESIKQNGLIQPIVVAATKSLTEEDFIALNLTENLHRKDLTPMEISIRLQRLLKLGLNAGEIAVRMGLPKGKVSNLLYLGKNFNENELKGVAFVGGQANPINKGKLSYTAANSIANARIPKIDKNNLITIAKKEGLTNWDLEVVIKLIHEGMSVRQALIESKKYRIFTPKLVIKNKDSEELMKKYNETSLTNLVYSMLKGKIPIEPTLFFINKNDWKTSYLSFSWLGIEGSEDIVGIVDSEGSEGHICS